MPEELHSNLEAPGSRPGRALAGAIAQLVEHQTPFAGVVSPTLVAASILPLVRSLIFIVRQNSMLFLNQVAMMPLTMKGRIWARIESLSPGSAFMAKDFLDIPAAGALTSLSPV